jgi:tetratricopeptide (TPR) repeat protein
MRPDTRRRKTPAPVDRISTVAAFVGMNRFAEALDCFFDLTEEERAHPSAQLWAATAAARMGRFDAAITLATAAETGYRNRGNQSEEIRALNLLGALALERGDLGVAEQRFRAVLERKEASPDRIIYAHATTNLASILDLKGQSDGALRLYYDGLRHYQEAADVRGIAQTYHNLNMVFRKLGMLEAAESVARQAVRTAESATEPSLLTLCLIGHAETRLERNDPDGAERMLAQARLAGADAADELCLAESLRVSAQLNLLRGRHGEAVEEAEISRSIAHRCGSALVAAECAAVSAIGLGKGGRTEEAAERRLEATRGFENLEAEWLQERYAREWDEACVPESP